MNFKTVLMPKVIFVTKKLLFVYILNLKVRFKKNRFSLDHSSFHDIKPVDEFDPDFYVACG